MLQSLKKPLTVAVLAVTVALSGTAVAFAETVYYKGTAVSWDHGRTWGVWSYSDVNSKYYEHASTANTTFSGWKAAGVNAHAEQFIGTATATAYWDCRG